MTGHIVRKLSGHVQRQPDGHHHSSGCPVSGGEQGSEQGSVGAGPVGVQTAEDLTPRQRELAALLAALLVADYKGFPTASVNSPAGRDRE